MASMRELSHPGPRERRRREAVRMIRLVSRGLAMPESARDGTRELAGVCWAGRVGRGCLGVMAHPRGGNQLVEKIRALRTECVDVLVSLLTPDEAMGLGLAEEQACCEVEGIEFESFPINDRGVPPQHELTFRFLEHLLAELWSGRNVVVHCRVGQGRSGLV